MKRALIASLVVASALRAGDFEDIAPILVNRTDVGRKAAGIVVGVIDESGPRVVSHALDGSSPVDGDTVFEIGSITKVFTSLLLADMVERGEVKLDDPVAKYLPEGVGGGITLLELSMHMSGLSPLPDNFRPGDLTNPYADYGPGKLYEYLSRYNLAREHGSKYEYSNLGAGLLGHALALRAGMSYEDLVQRRILEPLGMADTVITLSAAQKKRLATGHNSALVPVGNWDFDALAGAGALRSTANDMLKFVAANLELTDTPLKAAMRRMRSVRRETGKPEIGIAMGWHVSTRFGKDLVWHNGETAGYRSFAGFDPVSRKGVVVLCNTSASQDDLGLHILDARYPVARFAPPPERKEVALAADVLDKYAGEYEFAPGVRFKIVRIGARLLAEAHGQPAIELFAESDTRFFLKGAGATITFDTSQSGAAAALILRQNGRDQKALRIRVPERSDEADRAAKTAER